MSKTSHQDLFPPSCCLYPPSHASASRTFTMIHSQIGHGISPVRECVITHTHRWDAGALPSFQMYSFFPFHLRSSNDFTAASTFPVFRGSVQRCLSLPPFFNDSTSGTPVRAVLYLSHILFTPLDRLAVCTADRVSPPSPPKSPSPPTSSTHHRPDQTPTTTLNTMTCPSHVVGSRSHAYDSLHWPGRKPSNLASGIIGNPPTVVHTPPMPRHATGFPTASRRAPTPQTHHHTANTASR
jgi:hypothetical protein